MDRLLPRLLPGTFLRVSGVLTSLLCGTLWSYDASAFCRSTTCQGANCETDADDCPASGKPLYWPTSCVSYSFQKDGTQTLVYEQTQLAVGKAFAAWNELDCGGGEKASISFVPTEIVECKKSQYNKEGKNLNVVLFQDDDWTSRGIDGTLAKTSVTSNQETGEIYDADIEVNAANQELTLTDDPEKARFDLQAIMTHEVGHFLGIAHSPIPSATMYKSYDSGQISQRVLTQDDKDALCAIYPPDKPAVCNAEPKGGFGAGCEDVDEGGCSIMGGSHTHSFSTALAFASDFALRLIRVRRTR